ncbi:chemotaxis protein [Bradyrhizobium sp. SSBR45G]|uniref:chemotaxis protein n=1 Tax=unclassified Bradyrhizobium TaxID=2631580 RepID=UPI002342B33F|nr:MULTISPECIES: chemotaxis protein [unclassified Bradyrhizobium]GLH81950.1 chemotaxis protein [Bradyrhizobium sp. SSBR45G]GLH89447.1 chemotaxis protein [Bradyrhizobium sp. SSBR45R]
MADSLATIDAARSRIEETLAQVGLQLGDGRATFLELNQTLAELCQVLPGTDLEDVSRVVSDINTTLDRIVEALPSESALLARIARSVEATAPELKLLSGYIGTITIVARSARIEAASLQEDRESFLAFTHEAYELGRQVQQAVSECLRDQQSLAAAVDGAFKRQSQFDASYRDQLHGSRSELGTAHGSIVNHRQTAATVAQLTLQGTATIADAVGRAIVSLQSGDSTRQRLEHIRDGLLLASNAGAGSASAVGVRPEVADLLQRLLAMQLRDTDGEFRENIDAILDAFNDIRARAADVIAKGRSLSGGQDDGSSTFLDQTRTVLGRTLRLIAECESAGRAMDDAIVIVETTLTRFRHTVRVLSDVVADITLTGMNAGLRANRLGTRGRAFVVIANELNTNGGHIAAGAGRLVPLLDEIEAAANSLKALRQHSDPMQLARLEPSITTALGKVETGNRHLSGIMNRLTQEGREFEQLVSSARELMAALAADFGGLSAAADALEARRASMPVDRPTVDDQRVVDEVFARYTMKREREVHAEFMRLAGPGFAQIRMADTARELEHGIELF